MRLSKKGKRWYLVHEENGKQRWESTGLTNKADAEELLVKRRKEKERVDAGLAPSITDSKLGYLEAVEGFLAKKTQLEDSHQALLRGRLLTGAYQMFRMAEGHPIDKVKYYRKRKLKEEVIPYLKTKRLMELTPAVVEPWIDELLKNGVGRNGFEGNSFDTLMDKVGLFQRLTDFWYRRKKQLPQNPLDRLDVPLREEQKINAQQRLERRSFEPDEVVELFKAFTDLDRLRAENEKRPGKQSLPMLPLFQTLLFTGMRPSELTETSFQHVFLDAQPHIWVPREKCKTERKGERKATITPGFADELKDYRDTYRRTARPDDNFFLGPEGTPLDNERFLDQFYNGAYLAFIRMESLRIRISLSMEDQIQLTRFFLKGSFGSVGGSRLRSETLEHREQERLRLTEVAGQLRNRIEARIRAVDNYCWRHTHATWAADQEVPEVHIKKQLGHVYSGVTGRYTYKYSPRLIDPWKCSLAVWNLYRKEEADSQAGEDINASATAV